MLSSCSWGCSQADELTAEERAFAGIGGQEETAEDELLGAMQADAGGAAAGVPGARRRSGAAAGSRARAGQLWVDKYAPRHFMSLLSDERTNRQVRVAQRCVGVVWCGVV